ncbi:MAG: hypothetical protein H6621_05520 [Halobacteriovoraceae bacterium]|nr:hypothetical protein [Halobacteriovoraceae bacterium]
MENVAEMGMESEVEKKDEIGIQKPDEHKDTTLLTEVKEGPYHPIFPNSDFQQVQSGQFRLPSWALMSVLIVAFFVLKKFIYIKDDKRHGK